jgi:dTDP-4-amino-4,6-dideoxygalactose transaminase
MTERRIPFVDLGAQWAAIGADVRTAMAAVLDDHQFIQGPHVARFEREFGGLHDRPAVACSNGTAALEVAMRALGIGPGDEVITVAHTFFATAEAICNVGADPVFVDIDAGHYGMDPQAAAAAITPRTRALLPVHLYGSPCRIDELAALAERHGLFLIEDAAQAHLATLRGRVIGSFGDAACFSFYPGKNLGAYGDAGMILMRDAPRAAAARKLVNHGRSAKYEHDLVGSNHRMDALQAAVLSAKLPHLAGWTRRRREIARAYDARLKNAGFKTIDSPSFAEAVYHLYVVEVANRDKVIAHLGHHGIETGIHYPIPLHRQPAFADKPWSKVSLPQTERAAARVVSLPIFAELGDDAVAEICGRFLECAEA